MNKQLNNVSCGERDMTYETYRIFVYGTLKMAERNNGVIRNKCTRYVCDDYITGYSVYDMPYGFPFVKKTGKVEDVVHGEVWEVDYETLQEVNMLEGYSENNLRNHYDRVVVVTDEGLNCLMYVYKKFPPCNYIKCEDGVWNYLVNSMNYMEN